MKHSVILFLTLSTFVMYSNMKIRNPHDRKLILSNPDETKKTSKSVQTKTNSLIDLDSAPKKSSHKLKSKKIKVKKTKSKKLKAKKERKLYEKYNPKKYIKRYDTYHRRVENAKKHILGDPRIGMAHRKHQMEFKRRLHEKMMMTEAQKHHHNRPTSFRVNMKEFKQKHRRHQRELTKVVSDDAEDMNELHTNEDTSDTHKLESIPLLLVGDYEIIIEKK